MSSIPRQQNDKLVVGTNDVSQPNGESDKSPTGTAVLNACLCWKNWCITKL